jgi:hypothetical protein
MMGWSMSATTRPEIFQRSLNMKALIGPNGEMLAWGDEVQGREVQELPDEVPGDFGDNASLGKYKVKEGAVVETKDFVEPEPVINLEALVQERSAQVEAEIAARQVEVEAEVQVDPIDAMKPAAEETSPTE